MSPNAHIHFDELTILPFESIQPQASDQGVLYHDDFTNPASGWPEAKFDNYFIGYHEPEYYHVEVIQPQLQNDGLRAGEESFRRCHHRSQGLYRFRQNC